MTRTALAPSRLHLAVLGSSLLLGLAVAPAIEELPIFALVAIAVLLIGVVLLGPELVIVLALLAAAGLMPFVDTTAFLLPQIKGYFFFFWVAVAMMLVTWSARLLAGRTSWPFKPTLLLLTLLAQLSYVGLVMAATDPLAQPTLAAPFVEFPVTAVATYLWLSHDDAMKGLKRVLPLVVAIVAVWAASYVAAAGGCGGCRQAVSSHLAKDGLLGPDSRVYTPGQNSLLAFVLVAFGQALRRPRPLVMSLAALGLLCVALQGSRAQYFGMVAGMAVLIAWRFRETGPAGKLVLALVTTAAFAAILSSPVGERAITAYEDLSAGTGTPGFRIVLLEQASENWSLLGAGVTDRTLHLGVNEDLGFSNTLIVLGFVGGALQLAVLAVAFARGLMARTLAGATIAAVFLLLLVTRASLPLMELGHSAISYGAAAGLAAWLFVPARSHAPAVRRRRRRPARQLAGA